MQFFLSSSPRPVTSKNSLNRKKKVTGFAIAKPVARVVQFGSHYLAVYILTNSPTQSLLASYGQRLDSFSANRAGTLKMREVKNVI